jgi:DUF1680 family protein
VTRLNQKITTALLAYLLGLVTGLPAIAAEKGPAKKVATVKVETVKPVAFHDVKLHDGFWAKRAETNRKVTIPVSLKQCETSGRIDNFAIAGGLKEGSFKGYHFNDSDVYKVVEGAAYVLKTHPDPELEKYVDGVIAKIAAAQQKDGYLDTFFTIANQDQRFKHIHPGARHELYCMGHLIEAGAFHFEMTGKRNLLDVACKLADHIDSVFGPGRRHEVPEHQELELALIKLYRVTGEERYLKLGQFFIEQRGNAAGHKIYGPDSQDHLPVRKQSEVVGHAVRAMYHCAGMADLYMETGDASLLAACRQLWESTTRRKLYLTAGVGATARGEAFGPDYHLPNETSYAETCAAIGLVFFAHRMWQIDPDAEYMDVLECALYNGFLGGVSLEGDSFFYVNRLANAGSGRGSARREWFGCACCPSNVCRFVPPIPGYAYGHKGDNLYINQYLAGTATVQMEQQSVKLTQETNYPWDGKIQIKVEPEQSATFTIKVRIPAWTGKRPLPGDLYAYSPVDKQASDGAVVLQLNGTDVQIKSHKGYVGITRSWKKGDVVTLNLPMPIRRVVSHPKVTENTGLVALQRGPIVFCAEFGDNDGPLKDIQLHDDVKFTARHQGDLLGGVTVIESRLRSGKKLTAIPYYARSHRGAGEMRVWLPRP